MKRAFYLVIGIAVAAIVYVWAYPHLAGKDAATAQAAVAASNSQKAGASTAGGHGGFAIAVVTAAAQQETVPITKSAVGFVEPAATVVLRSRADGIVVAQHVTEGQTVKAGDVLFKLDDQSAQATIAKDQAQIAKDQANANSAKASLEREQDLVKKGVDPQSSLDAAVAAAKAAAATVTVDQAQLRADQVSLSYLTITAPIDGRVGTVNTSVGNVVHAADSSAGGLLTITAMTPLRVSYSIAEGDLDSFRQALAKNQKLPVDILVPGDKAPRAEGTLTFINSSVDTGSGTIVIKADVDNSAGKLWPGQYVTAITRLGAYADATTVPLPAVQQSSAGPFVYAIGADGKASKRKVTVIASVGDTAILGPEVQPGEHVVIEGQLRLSQGTPVKETLQGPAGKLAAAAPARSGGAGAAPAGKS